MGDNRHFDLVMAGFAEFEQAQCAKRVGEGQLVLILVRLEGADVEMSRRGAERIRLGALVV